MLGLQKPTMESSTDMTYCRRKKTRRGKKKIASKFYTNFMSDWADPQCGCGSSEIVANEDLTLLQPKLFIAPNHRNEQMPKKGKRRLRPYTSPRAPHNSTQFLMDDHFDSESIFCLQHPADRADNTKLDTIAEQVVHDPDSFYSGDMPSGNNNDEQCLSPESEQFLWKTSPAFSDLDYEYTPIQEPEDMIAFLQKDFQEAFMNAREHELNEKSKDELITDVQLLLCSANHLKNSIHLQTMKVDPSPTKPSCDINALHEELVRLQEENLSLRKSTH